MKKLLLTATASLGLLAGFTACEQDTDLTEVPGSSLISDNFTIVIDSSFVVEAKSIISPKVQARTTTQLLGAIQAPEYGTLRADFEAQLFPSNNIDTIGVTAAEIDSVKLQLVFDKGGFVGDSLALTGMEVYPLTKKLPYPIYSDFDPTEYYDASRPLGSGVFTAVGISVNDTVAASEYRYAYATLPRQFAVDIFNKYKEDPLLFNDPNAFGDYFPGIYVKNSFGSGRVTRINDTRVIMFYHKTQKLTNSEGVEVDSLTNHYMYCMATAPEVVSNTNISLQMSDNITQLADAGKPIILSPAGRDVEMTFPLQRIIETYRESTQSVLSVINTMTFTIPADSIANGRGITPPGYLLLVLSNEKEKFFAENKLPDEITSFIGTLDYTTMSYNFGDMRDYLIKMLEKETISAEDFTFTVTPVSMVTESSSSSSSSYYYYYYYGYDYTSAETLSGVSPLTAMPTMVVLKPEEAKIKLTFSKQHI